MKNIFKIAFAALFLTFVACDDDNNPDLIDPAGVRLVDLGIQAIQLNATNSNSEGEIFKLTWNNFTSNSTVEAQIALDPAFETMAPLGTSDAGFVSVSFMQLSQALANLGATALTNNVVYVRAMAGETASNAISFTVSSSSLPLAAPILDMAANVNGETFVVDPATASEEAFSLEWTFENESSTEVNFEAQVATAGTDFASILSGGSVNNANALALTFIQLNNLATQSGIAPDESGDLDIRIRASYDDAGTPVVVYSNPITITVTPTFILPRMAVPGNHQGWQPDESIAAFVPYIAASAFGATDYEGFMWLDGGYKYVEPNDEGLFVWGNTDWGDDGSFAGFMISEGEIDFPDAVPGYYRVRGDTGTNLYSRELTNWGIIGAATPSGWGSDTDMTYDATSRTWKISVALTPGEFKFRANDAWDINVGTDSNGDGSLDFGGPNFSVDTGGMYDVELDFSSPRQYTVSITAQ